MQEILIFIKIDNFQKLEGNILFLINKVNLVCSMNKKKMKIQISVLKIKIAQILLRFIMNTTRTIFELIIQTLTF